VEKADIIIIGGGIMGTSAAFFLSKKGLRVFLFDKSGVGRQASGSNAGTMAVQNKKLKLVPLVKESHRIWAAYQEELEEDVEFRQPGGLRVAEDAEQVKVLRESVAQQKKLGVELEILTNKDLRDFAPYIGPSVVAASFCQDDARSNPLIACMALAKASESRGAKIFENEPVQSISVKGKNRFLIQTPNGEYQSSFILNSAGVWSKNIFRMIGLEFPITLDTMQVMVTEQTSRIFSHVITHAKGNLTLKQVDSGNVVIGGGWKGIGNAEKGIERINYRSMKGNAQYAGRVIPALKKLHILRCWAGLEGRSPDFLPLLGQLKKYPGFYSACCVKGGQTLGPFLGKTVAELIADGKSAFPIDEFDVNRFASS
jgi:glycine/D-amino acid oxidase-like deaminating enzyme